MYTHSFLERLWPPHRGTVSWTLKEPQFCVTCATHKFGGAIYHMKCLQFTGVSQLHMATSSAHVARTRCDQGGIHSTPPSKVVSHMHAAAVPASMLVRVPSAGSPHGVPAHGGTGPWGWRYMYLEVRR